MTEPKARSVFPAPLLRILVTAVPIVLVCFLASGLHEQHAAANAMAPEAIAARLQPVAQAQLTPGTAPGGPAKVAALLKGQAVYEATCSACHGEGVAGAPKFGDKAAWAPRIARGFNTLVKHALEGFTGKSGAMPPKGGGNYEDVEVARAVAYMADKAGASFAEPATLAKK
jgi:cytochrome c5